MFKDFIFTMLIIECATWEQLFIQVSYVKLHPCNGVVSLWRSLGMAQSRYGAVSVWRSLGMSQSRYGAVSVWYSLINIVIILCIFQDGGSFVYVGYSCYDVLLKMKRSLSKHVRGAPIKREH